MPRAPPDTRRRALAVVLTALALAAAGGSARSAPAETVTDPSQPAAVGSVVGPTVAVPPPPTPTATAPAAAAVQVVPPRPRPLAHAAGTSDVTIRDFSFGPGAVTVHVGDTVTWANAGPTDHTATGAGFDTGVLSRGQSGSHTFTSAGTFSYHCSLHPFMKGTVTVVAAAASTPSSSTPSASSSAPPSGSAAAGSTAGSTAPATSAAPAPAPARAPPATLPHTGLDALALAALGALVLLLGVVLRRAARSR